MMTEMIIIVSRPGSEDGDNTDGWPRLHPVASNSPGEGSKSINHSAGKPHNDDHWMKFNYLFFRSTTVMLALWFGTTRFDSDFETSEFWNLDSEWSSSGFRKDLWIFNGCDDMFLWYHQVVYHLAGGMVGSPVKVVQWYLLASASQGLGRSEIQQICNHLKREYKFEENQVVWQFCDSEYFPS